MGVAYSDKKLNHHLSGVCVQNINYVNTGEMFCLTL